jgi:hypothetical protein
MVRIRLAPPASLRTFGPLEVKNRRLRWRLFLRVVPALGFTRWCHRPGDEAGPCLRWSTFPHCRPKAKIPHDAGKFIGIRLCNSNQCQRPRRPPPSRRSSRPDWPRTSRIWVSTGPHHTTRIQITRLGPLGIALLALLTGILALAGMTLLFGAVLIGIAAGGVLNFETAISRKCKASARHP